MFEEERNEVREKLKEKKRKEWQRFEISSWIFIAVLIFLVLIFFVDIWMRVRGYQSGEYTENILEAVKTLAFTICGYLFGKSKEECE